MSEVSLRAITPEDLPTLFENQYDPASATMAGVPIREEADFYVRRTRTEADPATDTRAVMVDGEMAGDVVSWTDESGRHVGYRIAQRFWGRGIATTALRLFLAELTDRPLQADLLKTNIGSRRVLEKNGFRLLAPDELPADAEPTLHYFRLDS
ncbi:GNAT family N-acetyltransferase [Kribbella sp. CA-293567]|uniref:GNAT family N-acetyltransferase n=1 Tax=Kribbella sp. CA-293567 TaxID=3002436 RepID=UPI0022DE3C16|nr:GNAT family N-acetyltransferase [Kribbella sp. CA-293567]WBQ06140.1 GNAT family N-acetyltransferase [Kribbella sp. CA-293567]